jgi:hypothetical protein
MAMCGVIRRLWAGERDLVRGHLLRQDFEDRQLRLGGYVSASHIAAYCEGLEWSRPAAATDPERTLCADQVITEGAARPVRARIPAS